MAKKYRFAEPEEFMTWLETQSIQLQVRIAMLMDVLIASGITGQEAAHLIYEAVEMGRKMPRPSDPTMN